MNEVLAGGNGISNLQEIQVSDLEHCAGANTWNIGPFKIIFTKFPNDDTKLTVTVFSYRCGGGSGYSTQQTLNTISKATWGWRFPEQSHMTIAFRLITMPNCNDVAQVAIAAFNDLESPGWTVGALDWADIIYGEGSD